MLKNIIFIAFGVLLIICLFYPKVNHNHQQNYNTNQVENLSNQGDPSGASKCTVSKDDNCVQGEGIICKTCSKNQYKIVCHTDSGCTPENQSPENPNCPSGQIVGCCDGLEMQYVSGELKCVKAGVGPKTCTVECKNNGTCDTTTGTCKCIGNWSGPDCGTHGGEPKKCKYPCKNGGTCDSTTGTCKCIGDWSGADCSQTVAPGNYKIHNSWTNLDTYKIGTEWLYSAPGNCDAPNYDAIYDGQCCGDPTDGLVCYGAWNDQVHPSKSGTGIQIDTGPLVKDRRKTIRLTTKEVYNDGLFILDVAHIPEGKATWPALWLTAKYPPSCKGSKDPKCEWPYYGEIDIIEGVNSQNYNQSTLHTRSGCTQTGPGFSNGGNCVGGGGCGVNAKDGTFGPSFNSAGGGVFACEWISKQTIKMWFFPRHNIPGNVLSSSPNPSSWGTPYASFIVCPAKDGDEFFKDLQLIINTTICGQWAGNAFDDNADKHAWDRCNAYTKNPANNKNFDNAFWSINSIKVYKK